MKVQELESHFHRMLKIAEKIVKNTQIVNGLLIMKKQNFAISLIVVQNLLQIAYNVCLGKFHVLKF